MDAVGTIAYDLCAIIEVIVWAWGICQAEFTRKKRDWVLAILVFIVAWSVLVCVPNYNVAFPIKELGHILGIMLLFSEKWGRKLVIYIFSFNYLELIYLPFRAGLFLISIYDETNWSVKYEAWILTILTIGIIFFMGIYLRQKKRLRQWIKGIPMRYYLLGIVCSFCANGIGSLTRLYSEEWNLEMRLVVEVLQTIVLIFIYLLGIGFAFVDIWRKQYKRDNLLKDEYLVMSQQHYDGLQEHMREVRRIRHDMKNHLFAIETYIRDNKIEEAKRYLQEIQEHQEWKSKPTVSIGNELVNAVLADGLGRHEEIEWKCEGLLPPQSSISDYDLCTLFSNMLSNSVEACQKAEGNEKWISLDIKTFQNQLLISMTNPIAERIDIEELGKYTSKEDKMNHGFGVANMRQVVEKYDGELEFICDENTCQVKISMYF